MSILDTLLSGQSANIDFLDNDEDEPTKKSIRIRNCSKHFNRIQKSKDGDWRLAPWRCGCVRECPICRQLKVEKVRGALALVANGETKIREGICNKDAANITRALGAGKYKRFPIDDETCTLIFVSDEHKGEVFDTEKLNSLDWNVLAISPEGKRSTGKLGTSPLGKKDGMERTRVAVITAPNATEKQWQDAGDKTKKATKDLDPHTAQEMDSALEKRAGFMCAFLQKAGVKYTIKYIMEDYVLEDIDWQRTKGRPSMETEVIAREKEAERLEML